MHHCLPLTHISSHSKSAEVVLTKSTDKLLYEEPQSPSEGP